MEPRRRCDSHLPVAALQRPGTAWFGNPAETVFRATEPEPTRHSSGIGDARAEWREGDFATAIRI